MLQSQRSGTAQGAGAEGFILRRPKGGTWVVGKNGMEKIACEEGAWERAQTKKTGHWKKRRDAVGAAHFKRSAILFAYELGREKKKGLHEETCKYAWCGGSKENG